ncbi:MAG: hypothetical protein ACLP1X_05380 [Polyangiaceae bacterium]
MGTTSRRHPSFEEEERLDGYRHAVERLLGTHLLPLEDVELDRFFDHIVDSFERGVQEGDCARGWLAARRRLTASDTSTPR